MKGSHLPKPFPERALSGSMEAADGQGHPSAHSPPTQRPKDNGKKTCVRKPRRCKTCLLQQSRKRDRPCVRIKRPPVAPGAHPACAQQRLLPGPPPTAALPGRPACKNIPAPPPSCHRGGPATTAARRILRPCPAIRKAFLGRMGEFGGRPFSPPEKGPSPSNPSRLSPDSPQGTHEIAYPHFAVVVPARLGKTHMPAVRGHLQAQDRAFFRDGNRVAGR